VSFAFVMLAERTFLCFAAVIVLIKALNLFLELLFYTLSDQAFSSFQYLVTILCSVMLAGLETSLRRQYQRKGLLSDYLTLAILIRVSQYFFNQLDERALLVFTSTNLLLIMLARQQISGSHRMYSKREYINACIFFVGVILFVMGSYYLPFWFGWRDMIWVCLGMVVHAVYWTFIEHRFFRNPLRQYRPLETALYTNAWLLVLNLPFIQSEANLTAYHYLIEHPEASLLCIVIGCFGYMFFYFALIMTSLASATTTEVVRSLGCVGAMCLRFVFLGKSVALLHFCGAILLAACAFLIQKDIFCDEGLRTRLSQLYSHYTAMEDESIELGKALSVSDATLEETQSMLTAGASGGAVQRTDDIDDDDAALSPGGRTRRRSISAI